MMTSLAQAYSPHPGGMQQQHPGMAQGHPMAVQHNPGQQGQPGPGMQQMQMGASGPGPQVSQGAVMMGGMPPGAAGPSQHALHHLNPNAQQQFMQQQLFAGNPQLQMQQQAMRQQAQAQRQAMLAQQYSGMPMGMQNGMNQMTQAQYHAMRGNPMARPVNLPQHLQQQQQQVAEHSLQQQQQQQHAAQQHHHQHQILLAQQLAIQQQAGNNNPGQPQMNPQHQNAQAQAAMMQQQQQQQQQAQAAAAAQQNQGQPQAQAQSQQPQQPQQNSQPQAQQPQQVPQQQQQAGMQQQQAVHAAMLQRQQGEKYKGQCLMKLMQFSDHLSQFGVSKQREDLAYWSNFVERFFSTKGVLRHSVWLVDETSNKQYEITFPALARYFHTHFESGIRNMQMVMERGTEKDLGNGHYVESPKSSFVYWFDNGSQLVANGTLKAHFDVEQKIELLEFITSNHEEYIPRNQVLNAARPMHEWGKEWHKVNSPLDGKQSPEMNKKKAKTMKSPPQPPPEFDIPESKVKSSMGITPAVFRYLEFAEVLGMMNPLFNYSHQHPALSPPNALEQYVSTIATNAANPNGQQQNPSGPRTPGMGNFQSPGVSHLNLPDGPSPRASPAQAPGMQLQQSQHGTNSSGPSANTSPNTNKRRRPSTVKAEEEIAQQQLNGTKTAVKPSPRIGGKRQKGNPA